MMCRKSTFEALKETYETRNFDSPVNKCKFFTLFALGEVYSIRSNSSTGQVPGVNYYAKSLALIQILPERPTITHIENLLLLVSLLCYLAASKLIDLSVSFLLFPESTPPCFPFDW